ncbi:MAG: DegT/DnrJ/EryC1/StrS family aminotransferase [Candidatus Binatia bacterium]
MKASFIPHPSSFPHVPLSVPYWSGATYRAILRSFLSGSVVDGPGLGKLRFAVIERLGVEDAVLCGSGSFALEIILRACRVGSGDEVIIPTFCCTALVLPILRTGAIPVLADMGEELNMTRETVEAAITEKTGAVIVPHLFGNPADITATVEFACGTSIRVIDDAAQALGATIDGRPVGSFGDAGILSFGAEKVCFGLGGGVAVSRNKGSLDLKNDLPRARLSSAVRRLLSTTIRRRWRRWTLPAERMIFNKGTTGPENPPVPYRKEQMANLNAAVALSLMRTLDTNVAARRARVQAYQDLLGEEERLQLIPHRPGSACLTQVVRVLPRHRGDDAAARLINVLGRAGYELQGSYVPIHLLSQYEQWARGPLPQAERVWGDLIELPCEPDVGLDHVEHIGFIIKRALNS